MIPNLILNDLVIPVELTRRKGMKRIVLRISKTINEIKISASPRMPLREIIQFVNTSRPWIENQLSKKSQLPPKQSLIPNMTLCLGGKDYFIQHEETKRPSFKILDTSLIIHGPQADFEPILLQCLKQIAHEKCAYWSGYFATIAGSSFKKISIKDVKSRWGSCSSKKNLNYNWRIILAPEPILMYLCAHEVSHLKHMNHSSEFWSLVASLCPDYKAQRAWLKKKGETLYRYG